MATKKQKRATVLAKRAVFLEEVRRSGLEAQRRHQERQDTQPEAAEDWVEWRARESDRAAFIAMVRDSRE